MNSVFPSFRRHNNNNMLHRIAITMVFESYYSVLLSVMLLTETTNILCHYWQSIKWNHFQGKKEGKLQTQHKTNLRYITGLGYQKYSDTTPLEWPTDEWIVWQNIQLYKTTNCVSTTKKWTGPMDAMRNENGSMAFRKDSSIHFGLCIYGTVVPLCLWTL